MVSRKAAGAGFTLLELLVAMALGMMISLAMINYLIDSLKSSAIMRAEKRIVENGQRALQILSDAAREAGSGNLTTTHVPLYSGPCGTQVSCTNDGAAREGGMSIVPGGDVVAFARTAADGRDCTGADVGSTRTRIANVFYVGTDGESNGLYCRGYDLDLDDWVSGGEEAALVEGIDLLQVMYRYVDENGSRYLDARAVPTVEGSIEKGFDRIRAVNFSVLAQDGENGQAPDTPSEQRYTIGSSATLSYNDRVLRRVYSTDALIMSKQGTLP